jgi:hypothetical protein
MYGKGYTYLQVEPLTVIKNYHSPLFLLSDDKQISDVNINESYDKNSNYNNYVGALLAGTLDYFGKHEEAESLCIELLEANPSGDYFCDYAIFLHRRKRDYEQAEM